MKKEKFEKLFKKADSQIRLDYQDLLERSIKESPELDIKEGQRNLTIVLEELAELSKCVTKAMRGKVNKTNLIEEMADVSIGMSYVSVIFGITNEDVTKAINVKLDQLESDLNEKSAK